MLDMHQIILAPIITEKSSGLKRDFNTYTFKVHEQANKIQIKEAVEKLFNVKVLGVTLSYVRSKVRRLGRSVGKTSHYKKAMVKIVQGQKVDLVEGIL